MDLNQPFMVGEWLVEPAHRLACGAVFDQFDHVEEPGAADIAQAGGFFRQHL